MQFLLFEEFDASKGGGSAPDVVVYKAQITNTKVIFQHVSFC